MRLRTGCDVVSGHLVADDFAGVLAGDNSRFNRRCQNGCAVVQEIPRASGSWSSERNANGFVCTRSLYKLEECQGHSIEIETIVVIVWVDHEELCVLLFV